LANEHRETSVRDFEKLLVLLNIVGSVIQGWRHEVDWLLVPAVAFAAYVVLEDRALRRQIGDRAWPSPGFADFTFGTNLAFMVGNIALSAVLLGVAGAAAGVLGF
jgi:hypothetical protein